MHAGPIQPFAEDQLTLSQAARRLPRLRRERPVSPSTLWRWHRHGLRAQDGAVVRLRAWRVGGQTLTSEAALREFFARLSAGAGEAPAQAAPADDGARGKEVEDQLDALGIA
jgi:hypothetical protein